MTGSNPLLISVLDVIQHIKACSTLVAHNTWGRLKVAYPEVRNIFIIAKCYDKDKRHLTLTLPFAAGYR